jgi:uncharacterized protein (DUF58 family)
VPESVILERLLPAAGRNASALPGTARQRVYILPTQQGMIFSILLLTMLLGAVNYNNSLAFMLTFLLGGVFMICMVHTYRNLVGLVITAALPEPVFAGSTAHFPIIMDNKNGQLRPAFRLVCQPEGMLYRKSPTRQYIPVFTDLQADCYQRVMVPVPARNRGLLSLECLVISTSFPMGLFRAWSYITVSQICVVYPAPTGKEHLPAPLPSYNQGQRGTGTGVHDFVGFRQYHPGDSIRTIVWKALAREQPLLVKRFSGEGGHTLMLSFENVLHLATIEASLSQLCVWIITAERQGYTYGLDIPGAHHEPGRGAGHQRKCLESLARFGLKHAD